MKRSTRGKGVRKGSYELGIAIAQVIILALLALLKFSGLVLAVLK